MLDRHLVAFDPSLDRRMAGMAQFAGDLSDAPKPFDDCGVGFHNPLVRCVRTYVNLESVRTTGAKSVMASPETIGDKLARLRARSGLSLDAVARGGGYKGRSSVQRYFDANYDPDFLPLDVARNLADSMAGTGDPVITRDELLTLAGVSEPNVAEAFPLDDKLGGIGSMARDIPIYGTALGGDVDVSQGDGGEVVSVEQAELDQSEVIGYLRRPPSLSGNKDLYGVYVAGSSMYPRFADGEAALVDPKRPPMIGDDVVVHLVSEDGADDRIAMVLIKRLVRRSASYIELEQFSPPLTFRVKAQRVRRLHRIVPAGELFS
jgi:hypothetical protein